MLSPTKDLVRFGPFELDLNAWQLRKSGMKIRIPLQPLQLLAVLLERPGVTVRREELQQRLWTSEVFVDFEQGLNKNIGKLREALGDSADSPSYIETIPRIGYRFIGEILDPPPLKREENAVPAAGIPSPEPKTRHSKWGRKLIWGVLVGCAAASVGIFIWWAEKRWVETPIRSVVVLPWRISQAIPTSSTSLTA